MHLLLDRDGIVIGVLLGMPKDLEGWKEVLGRAHASLRNGADKISACAKSTTHRRGTFPSLAHGISFGGGQKASLFTNWMHLRIDPVTGTSVPEAPLQDGRCGAG